MRTLYKNKKTGKFYIKHDTVTNATNEQEGQRMVFYMDEDYNYFVREEQEFYEKFEEVK
jgi:hypothetical protein